MKSFGAGPILGDQHNWQVFDTGVSARGTGPKLLELEGKKVESWLVLNYEN